MSTEVTNQEPVLVLDDKKYVISELSDTAKYIVGNLNNLQMKLQNNQMEGDQLRMAQEGLTARLKQEVDKAPEDSEEEVIVEED
jgi:predicted transcriptional regulator